MRFIRWFPIMVCTAILGIPALTEAFNIELTPEHVKEAMDYGKKYKGKEIFSSPTVKQACFGRYPEGDGGLIMSKFIRIAVVSAMMAMNDKTVTPEVLKEIDEESTTFDVVVNVSDEEIEYPEDVQIMLEQGLNVILPLTYKFGMKYKGTIKSVVGVFQNIKINPKTSTTVYVKTRNIQKKYKINFSDVK